MSANIPDRRAQTVRGRIMTEDVAVIVLHAQKKPVTSGGLAGLEESVLKFGLDFLDFGFQGVDALRV